MKIYKNQTREIQSLENSQQEGKFSQRDFQMQKIQNQTEFCENHSQHDSQQSSNIRIKAPKTKLIKKEKKLYEKAKENPIWPNEYRKKFLMFLFENMIKNPYHSFSWLRWKPCGYYLQQSLYVGDKTHQQCKSYDERLKKQAFSGSTKMDMLQKFFQILIKEFKCPQVIDLLQRYKRSRKLLQQTAKVEIPFQSKRDHTSQLYYLKQQLLSRESSIFLDP